MGLIHRRNAVRLGLPALIVAILAGVALWRVGPSPQPLHVVSTTGAVPPSPSDTPLSHIVDVLAANAVGREASLEHVEVQEIIGHGAFWASAGGERPVFAVVGGSVVRAPGVELEPGREVTLLGVVRAAPTEDEARQRWQLDAATAHALREGGTYLEVREIR
jgi:hypothetical protein